MSVAADFALSTGVAAGATVCGVIDGVDASTVAIGAASYAHQTALTITTNLTVGAGICASSAVRWIIGNVDTGTCTVGASTDTFKAALTAAAHLAVGAGVVASAAVRGIVGRIDASAGAVGAAMATKMGENQDEEDLIRNWQKALVQIQEVLGEKKTKVIESRDQLISELNEL